MLAPRRHSGGSLQRQLPDEILSMIFTAAFYLCDDPLSAISIPLTLSHVCARWRKISISTSILWTRLVLFFPAVDSAQTERTTAWLARSKLQPLEILLDFRVSDWWEHDEPEENHPFTVESLELVLKILLRHLSQWKTFEMLTDTWEPIHAFLCHINTNVGGVVKAPLLQSVALSRCNEYFVTKGASFQPDDLKEPVALFGGDSAELDRLRDVSLTGVHVDWTRSCLRNLHDLSLKFHSADVMPSLPEFESMLSACPKLEGLTVLGWGPVLQDDSDGTHKTKTGSGCPQESKPVLHLPSLKSFSYGFVDSNYAIQFLGLLSMPSLHSFELQDLAASMSLSVHAPLDSTPLIEWLILSHQCHSSPGPSHHIPLGQIECLELEGLRSSKEMFARFLRAFASLKKICLSNADRNLMSALHPGERDRDDLLPGAVVIEGRERRRSSFASTSLTPLCPQLADMVCRRVDYKSLSEIVSARCQEGSGVQPLQTLEIDSSGDEFEDEGSSHTLTNEDHELLVKSGVDLVVHGRGEARV
ncbi:hypothetical protein AAF712_010778 [Marasmius tenuissimus]|uniref:F-box domain-containing protein n=1 Tax=Marasmius tenuissimus TaxID=585030 RepID=A0ABR2ZPQ5_9AGAR